MTRPGPARFLDTPDVDRKIDYLFIGQGTADAEGRFGARVTALPSAPSGR